MNKTEEEILGGLWVKWLAKSSNCQVNGDILGATHYQECSDELREMLELMNKPYSAPVHYEVPKALHIGLNPLTSSLANLQPPETVEDIPF